MGQGEAMRHLPLILTALFSLPATAAEPVFSGFMNDAVTGQFASDGSFEKLDTPRVGLIQTGSLDISLEQTSMAAVLEAYGGTLNDVGEAGGRVLWICYAVPSGFTVWFYSDGEMGGGDVTAVATEVGAPDPSWGCSPSPPALQYLQLDIPGLSAHPTELDAVFVPVPPDAAGRVGFTSESPHPVMDGFKIWQDYVYRIGPDGIVDAVAVVQITGD